MFIFPIVTTKNVQVPENMGDIELHESPPTSKKKMPINANWKK